MSWQTSHGKQCNDVLCCMKPTGMASACQPSKIAAKVGRLSTERGQATMLLLQRYDSMMLHRSM